MSATSRKSATTVPTGPRPSTVVVTGPPASGKTTLARAIADALGWPLYTKDTFKELLYDTIGTGDLEWSAKLGAASMELLGLVLRTSQEPLVVEANFRRLETERVLVQVFCTDEPEAIVRRYRERGDRHPGHLDDERVPDPSEYSPLPLAGECIVYRVGDDLSAVVECVRRCVS